VELDGGQHLGDADAYRRGRRKDQLLQENGYLVLRFLALDVVERLDAVLDAIQRGFGKRRSACAQSDRNGPGGVLHERRP
jgi:very-short-patch-repair endonuclease